MRSDDTFCEMCGSPALARVQNVWLCAGCGLEATRGSGEAAGTSGFRRLARRGLVASAMSAGLLTKLMIGAVAVAAVSAATIPFAQPGDTPVPTSAATLVVDSGSGLDEAAAEGQPEEVTGFVDDVQAWSACIKAAVDEHVAGRGDSRAGFDPQGACGEPPKYVGRDGELPAQASDQAGENRRKNDGTTPGEPQGNANGKAATEEDEATEADKGRTGNANGKGNAKGKDKPKGDTP